MKIWQQTVRTKTQPCREYVCQQNYRIEIEMSAFLSCQEIACLFLIIVVNFEFLWILKSEKQSDSHFKGGVLRTAQSIAVTQIRYHFSLRHFGVGSLAKWENLIQQNAERPHVGFRGKVVEFESFQWHPLDRHSNLSRRLTNILRLYAEAEIPDQCIHWFID